MLLLLTLNVVTQHLPVALSTSLSKTLASLQQICDESGVRDQEAGHAVLLSMTLARPQCVLCWFLSRIILPFRVQTSLQLCSSAVGKEH